jgi:hypothetical protein
MLPLLVFGQAMKERRVYYLDCTGSMQDQELWNPVRDNLKNAINQVKDETTELLVIPFTDDQAAGFRPPLKVYKEFATTEGKNRLKQAIDNLNVTYQTYTSHYVPIYDFATARVDNNRVTYMFLMTDGKANRQENEFMQEVRSWGNRFGSKNVYGFYVLLHENAANPAVIQEINRQKHLWSISTANVNINLIRLENNGIFNVRNEESVEIPVYGNLSDVKVSASGESADYKVTAAEVKGDKLCLKLSVKSELSQLPSESILPVKITAETPQFTFLMTDQVTVRCINQKEYSLKVRVK